MVIFNPDEGANNDKVTVNSTTTDVRSLNRARKFLFLTNDSDEVIYLALGPVAVMNKGIRLNASGGNTLIDEKYTGPVTAICSSGSKNLCICEG